MLKNREETGFLAGAALACHDHPDRRSLGRRPQGGDFADRGRPGGDSRRECHRPQQPPAVGRLVPIGAARELTVDFPPLRDLAS
jgi:hypothetical protein